MTLKMVKSPVNLQNEAKQAAKKTKQLNNWTEIGQKLHTDVFSCLTVVDVTYNSTQCVKLGTTIAQLAAWLTNRTEILPRCV